MRPTAIESIRGIQAALAEAITPEMQTEFGRSVVQTLQMLLESLASEWNSAADDLYKDYEVMMSLLARCASEIAALPPRNDRLSSLVPEIERVLDVPQPQSLLISDLARRNNDLRLIIERLLVGLEDVIDERAYATMKTVRKEIYEHLRETAARGWSFWDAASFRERMARERST